MFGVYEMAHSAGSLCAPGCCHLSNKAWNQERLEMRKITNCLYIISILALALIFLSACQTDTGSKISSPTDAIQPKTVGSSQPQQAELETPTPNGSSVVSTNTLPLPEDGISFEELRESTPLAPINLRASLLGQGVLLEWDPAPPADFTHSYSDRISHYNVYKSSAPGSDLILLAETDQPYLIDQDLIPGTKYFYAVSAVHEGPVEGLRTEVLMWTHP